MQISAGGKRPTPEIAPNSWAVTVHRTALQRWNAAAHFRKKLALGSIPAPRSNKSSNCARADELEITFFLGQAENRNQAREIHQPLSHGESGRNVADVTRGWDDVLGAVQVKTPDPSMEVMLNRWLLYQTLGCRVWARAAFYQLSGAYGFRDQLQDVMALSVSKRSVAREHLLRAASRQFIEGDVQHWWHPPSGRGIRTQNL